MAFPIPMIFLLLFIMFKVWSSTFDNNQLCKVTNGHRSGKHSTLPPWKFTCIYSSLVKLINILQCLSALFSIVKKLLLITFYLICFMAFASNHLHHAYKSINLLHASHHPRINNSLITLTFGALFQFI